MLKHGLLIFCLLGYMANGMAQYDENRIPVGKVARDILFNKKFGPTFAPGYTQYQPQAEAVQMLKKFRKQLTFKIVMGFWCEDSQKHVPHFLKIIEAAGFTEEQFKIYGVDEQKQAAFEGFNSLNIVQVPTFILYIDKKEVGRIVESPKGANLEEDILRILIPNQP
jgi:thiol-disulfide isomerase/thioredoxin